MRSGFTGLEIAALMVWNPIAINVMINTIVECCSTCFILATIDPSAFLLVHFPALVIVMKFLYFTRFITKVRNTSLLIVSVIVLILVGVTATYMQYACGECTLDMKVTSINDRKYKFIIGNDIDPVPMNGSNEDFCNYVQTMFYDNREQNGIYEFTLAGKLHRWPSIFGSCSTTCFSIRYGKGEWKEFR